MGLDTGPQFADNWGAPECSGLPGVKLMTILKGHVSPETAYVVDDYPYGYNARCKIRYWLEYREGHGFRFVSQTTNPRKGHVWNKPKASTYAAISACMVINEEGHVNWVQLTAFSGAAEALAFQEKYGDGVPEIGRAHLQDWISLKARYEKSRDERAAARAEGSAS